MAVRRTGLYPDGRDLDRRVWQATFDPRTIASTAAAGDGLLLMRHSPATRDPGAFRAEQADRARQYLVACSATGHRPRIALSHTVFPAPDRRTAIAELTEGLDRWEAFKATGGGDLRDRLAAENVTYGHPEEIVAELLANVAVGYADELLLGFQPAVLPHEQALRKVELIAETILPALAASEPDRLADQHDGAPFGQTLALQDEDLADERRLAH
jgi:alkanesulfonate monooxygenase SsuD/methylene tetrahydromethanopterin reductase-like flavin-dependent oxidoreductase (luciferase family)